jgi:hypothetical protein
MELMTDKEPLEEKDIGMALLKMCGGGPGKTITRAEALLVLIPFMQRVFGTEYARYGENLKKK